ncbi:thiopurine S-methyltransferase [Cardiobacteriaceae bacterium TAE3-ERU3]|nr:thiopurine S-methyltransferase [Cardiobacteriaceae bacterium TAE3-ERU3]
MNPDYWHNRWRENRIGFHQATAHPMLTTHYTKLALPEQPRIFVPLCGKSHDIGWLLEQGAHVIGCELSPLAIEQLFTQLNLTPTSTTINGNLTHCHTEQLDIFIGNFFDLSPSNLDHIDAVYDRAALIALPPELRPRYSEHLHHLTNNAAQLLITFDYDQALMSGPPFAVPEKEICQHYAASHHIEQLEQITIPDFKQTCPATETIYKLTPHR